MNLGTKLVDCIELHRSKWICRCAYTHRTHTHTYTIEQPLNVTIDRARIGTTIKRLLFPIVSLFLSHIDIYLVYIYFEHIRTRLTSKWLPFSFSHCLLFSTLILCLSVFVFVFNSNHFFFVCLLNISIGMYMLLSLRSLLNSHLPVSFMCLVELTV